MKYVLLLISVSTLIVGCDLSNYEKIKLRNGDIEVVKRVQINDSLICMYYDNGNLYQETHLKIGVLGYEEKEVLHYRKNGQLDKYSIYADDKLQFYKFYESEPSYGGNPIFYKNMGGEYFDTIPVNSTIEVYNRIANPPNCIPHILIGNYVENDSLRDMKTDPVWEIDINNGEAKIVDRFVEVGDFKKTLYWSIEDTLLNHYYNGKNIWHIHVINN